MTNTKNYCTPTRRYEDHSTFSGLITEYDFNGYKSMTDYASSIISDYKFDLSCRKDLEAKRNYKRKGRK